MPQFWKKIGSEKKLPIVMRVFEGIPETCRAH
jgi:hypothetical protein